MSLPGSSTANAVVAAAIPYPSARTLRRWRSSASVSPDSMRDRCLIPPALDMRLRVVSADRGTALTDTRQIHDARPKMLVAGGQRRTRRAATVTAMQAGGTATSDGSAQTAQAAAPDGSGRARRPAIVAVDDEPAVLAAVARDLRRGFGESYRILRAPSGAEALEVLKELRTRGDPVALLVADQRMPGMSGTEYLVEARQIVPEAKRVLLTAYADTEAAISAINEVSLDYYLLKPWDPPQEQLFPVLEDLLETWQSGTALEAGGVRIIGHRFSKESHDLRDFLARNRVPARWIDVERDGEARELLTVADVDPERLPVALLEDGTVLERPSVLELAERLGVAAQPATDHYDLVIVGGGPAGLGAAVYGASEGLRTVMVEREAPGGQAGQSSRIENYLGFPMGLSGSDLARRATDQARRLGAELLTVQDAVGLLVEGSGRIVQLSGGAVAERQLRARRLGRLLQPAERPRLRRAAAAPGSTTGRR